MKIRFLAVATTLGCAAVLASAIVARATPTPVEAPTYTVDAVHSGVFFRIRHMGVSNFYGRFNAISGTFSFDPANLEGCSISVEVPVDSVDTNNESRDNHLKGPDFFNAPEHPKATFRSTSFEKISDSQYSVKGDLSFHGKTNDVTAVFNWIGEGDRGERMGYRAGFDVTLEFERSEWGVDHYLKEGGLGDTITLLVAIEGQRK